MVVDRLITKVIKSSNQSDSPSDWMSKSNAEEFSAFLQLKTKYIPPSKKNYLLRSAIKKESIVSELLHGNG